MYINYFEGQRSRPNIHKFYFRAEKVLKDQAHGQDWQKRAQRKKFLSDNPDKKITVDTKRLRQIIPYTQFKCSPYSSIVRGEAIHGSDIDGGVVFTAATPTLDTQLAFVAELRSQGFSAYHEIEVDAAHTRADAAHDKWYKATKGYGRAPEEIGQLFREAYRMEDQKITFLSLQDIRDCIGEGRLEMPLVIYLAGTPIY